MGNTYIDGSLVSYLALFLEYEFDLMFKNND